MHPPAAGVPDGFGVAKRLDACIDQQAELCLALEELADSLPSRVDTHAAMVLVDRLATTLRRCHRLEEAMVFPVLRITNHDIGPVLERLRTEHVEDEDLAEDLRATMEIFVTRRKNVAADEIGYMLRGLFTALRRHLAFDRDHILPLYRRSCGL